MSTTHHELLTFSKIFDSGKGKLVVPDYQRSYSWEEGHRKDLIADIEQAQKSSHTHFAGTIVLSQSKENPDVFEIVDGQQRLTTLILLMLAIIRKSKELEIKAIGGENLEIIKSRYIVSGADSGDPEYRLELNRMQSGLFRSLINNTVITGEEKTKYDLNLTDAEKQFKEFLKGKDAACIETLYKVVTENLGFLVYAPEKSSETGLMFEVINNRGKPLSNLEKVKNYLIYFSERNFSERDGGSLKTTIRDKWPEILRCLSDANMTFNWDEDSFLRVCWLVFADSSKKKSHDVYDELKKKYPPDDGNHWEVLQEFVEFLAKAADTYKKMFQRNQEKESEVEKKLELISLHPAYISIMPLVIAVDIKSDNDKDKEEIIDILEKLNFRYYNTWISGRADSGQGELFRLAYNFYNEKKDQSKLQSELKTSLISFIDNNAGDYTFVKHLTLDEDEAGDYYGWRGLKFFLANYEEKLWGDNGRFFDVKSALKPKDEKYPNSFSEIEHIWATGEKDIDDRDAQNINKRRLGNFLLLAPGVNRSVGNDRVEEKINEGYFKRKVRAETKMTHELPKIFKSSKEKWDEERKYETKNYWRGLYMKFLDKREEGMINFALERWSVEGVKDRVKEVKINSSRKGNENFVIIWKDNKKNNNTENDNEQTE